MLLLFGAAVSLSAFQPFVPPLKNSGWPDAVLLAITAVATLAAFAGQLPVTNVFLAGTIAAAIGGILHAVNNVIGLPFGRFEFKPGFGPQVFDVLPVAMPVLWAVASLNARGVARRLLQHSRTHPRHGYHVIALAAGLMMIFQLTITPFAVMVKNWWTPDATPLLNLASWIVLSLIIQIAMTPLLLDKFPVPRPPNFSPVLVWVGMNLLMAPGLVSKQWRVGGTLLFLVVQAMIFLGGLRRRR